MTDAPTKHAHVPSAMHMGDCSTCGQLADAEIHSVTPTNEEVSKQMAWCIFTPDQEAMPWTCCAGQWEAKSRAIRGKGRSWEALTEQGYTMRRVCIFESDVMREMDETTAAEKHLREGIENIRAATTNGSVCDDIAWYDNIETLHNYCTRLLEFDPSQMDLTPPGENHD